jgi:hypothetical protein
MLKDGKIDTDKLAKIDAQMQEIRSSLPPEGIKVDIAFVSGVRGVSIPAHAADMAVIVANYKETQMTRIRVGQPARATVDAFPGVVLHGHVDSWSPASGAQFALLPPDNATGNFTKVVQRIPVKIVLDPDPALAYLLRPGMSVIATVDTSVVPADAAAVE